VVPSTGPKIFRVGVATGGAGGVGGGGVGALFVPHPESSRTQTIEVADRRRTMTLASLFIRRPVKSF
jgi:hypothetical protein